MDRSTVVEVIKVLFERWEEGYSVLHLLAIGRRRRRNLVAYHMEDLDELSCIDISSLNRFIGSSE